MSGGAFHDENDCGWDTPVRIRDSVKPWAVLYLDQHHRIQADHTQYAWTRGGAKRLADRLWMSGHPLWTAKVVSNR